MSDKICVSSGPNGTMAFSDRPAQGCDAVSNGAQELPIKHNTAPKNFTADEIRSAYDQIAAAAAKRGLPSSTQEKILRDLSPRSAEGQFRGGQLNNPYLNKLLANEYNADQIIDMLLGGKDHVEKPRVSQIQNVNSQGKEAMLRWMKP